MPVKLVKLENVKASDNRPAHTLAIYEIKHSSEKTILIQTVQVALMPWGMEFSYTLHDFEAKTFEEGRLRLADWFARMAEALKEPGKINQTLPFYSGESE